MLPPTAPGQSLSKAMPPSRPVAASDGTAGEPTWRRGQVWVARAAGYRGQRASRVARRSSVTVAITAIAVTVALHACVDGIEGIVETIEDAQIEIDGQAATIGPITVDALDAAHVKAAR